MRVAASGIALLLVTSACGPSPSPSTEVLGGPFGPEATCTNDGVPFQVTYPETWFLHPRDPDIRVGACTHFGPAPFEVEEALAGRGSSVWVHYLNGSCLGFISEVLGVEQTIVAGKQSYRVVSKSMKGEREYMYVVDLNPPHLKLTGPPAGVEAAGADCDQARGLVVGTTEGVPGEFAVNRAIVDRMADTLQVGP